MKLIWALTSDESLRLTRQTLWYLRSQFQKRWFRQAAHWSFNVQRLTFIFQKSSFFLHQNRNINRRKIQFQQLKRIVIHSWQYTILIVERWKSGHDHSKNDEWWVWTMNEERWTTNVSYPFTCMGPLFRRWTLNVKRWMLNDQCAACLRQARPDNNIPSWKMIFNFNVNA